MKDNEPEKDKLIDDVVSKLRQLSDLQLKHTIQKQSRPEVVAREEGKAPVPADPPPKTARDKLLDEMIAARKAKFGTVTKDEEKALADYVDEMMAKEGVEDANDLTKGVRDSMLAFAKDNNEDMLLHRRGMEDARVSLGPVGRACETIPGFTTSRYQPEPKPPEKEEPQNPIPKPQEPRRPDEQAVLDRANQLAMEAGHKGWLGGPDPTEEDKARARAELAAWYPAAMEVYRSQKAQYDEEQAIIQAWNQYRADHKDWEWDCGHQDVVSRQMDTALAVGLMRVDKDPDTGKYNLSYYNNNTCRWETESFENADDARLRARELMPYRDFASPLAVISDNDITPEQLAAVASGALTFTPDIVPGEPCVSVTVRRNMDKNGNLVNGTPETWTYNDDAKRDELRDYYKDYETKAHVKWDEIDGRLFDNVEQHDVLVESCTTDVTGQRICSSCGQVWPEETPPEETPSEDAPPAENTSPAEGGSSTDTPPAAGAIAPRGVVDRLERKLQYRAGYFRWERVEAATKLTKVALTSAGSKELTQEQLTGLMQYIYSVLGQEPAAARSFLSQLTSLCASCASIHTANLNAVVARVSSQLPQTAVRKRRVVARTRALCSLCGQELPEGQGEATTEITKAREMFKGQILTDEAAKRFAGRQYVPGATAELLRDGTQQLYNPFSDDFCTWTRFSFRPSDETSGYPVIRTVPASFRGMTNIDRVLSNMPFILVKEYFMRNNVSSAINLLMGVLEGKDQPVNSAEANTPSKNQSTTSKLIEFVKNAFEDLQNPADQVIYMPFVLYHRLKAKMYGNQYVFPYIPKDSPITMASNDSEWGGNGGLLGMLADGIQSVADSITGVLGFGVAKPFPAPTWKQPGDDGWRWQLQFQLNLINDEFIRARNNYMCANTIIHNNRWIQKTILSFPGALYEVVTPTGVRELMCTGSFTLKPLGVNRHVPHDFFQNPFDIGSNIAPAQTTHPLHSSAYEVVPDAYTLDCTFKSAIPENLNNSVFGYYLKLNDFAPGTPADSALDAADQSAPWTSMAQESETTSDLITLQESVVDVRTVIGAMTDTAAGKAAAEEESALRDALGVSPPANPGATDPAAPTGMPARGGSADTSVKKRSVVGRDKSKYDDTIKVYVQQHDTLRARLSLIKTQLDEQNALLRELLLKSESLPLTNVRKTHARRIAKVRRGIQSLVNQQQATEDALIRVEVILLMRAKDRIEEQASSEILVVPRGYFDPYEVDELTRLKIKMMTRDELTVWIAQQEEHLQSIDKWGLHNCKDFWIRMGVIQFIVDKMEELEDLIRDAAEVDLDQCAKYQYRYEMLNHDLNAALDASKPFIMNRTNVVYISPDDLPSNLIQTVSAVTQPSTTSTTTETGSSTEETPTSEVVETSTDQSTAVVPVEDGTVIADRKELIKQHRAEVVKHVFGSEEGLAAKAFEAAMESSPAARADREVLILLKRSPQLDDEPSVYEWLKGQGDTYQDVVSRLESDTEGVAILPASMTEEERVQALAELTRRQALFYITQDLYRYVSSHRTVLLGNAMDGVSTRSSRVLARVTDEFQRLEN